jgi:MoxR-like ATPase
MMERRIDERSLALSAQRAQALVQEVQRVYVGPREVVELLIIALLARGHVLLEGVPGVAKTTLVKAFAATLGCVFRRIQFTPDLLPADITGTYVLSPRSGEFQLREGPLFANVVLGDEINRAPAKTQSALLQAMQEREVTIDRETHPLSPAFTVFATQNPIESEGTYPLPEAELDRFMLKVRMDYPDARQELEMVREVTRSSRADMLDVQPLRTVLQAEDVVYAAAVSGTVAAVTAAAATSPERTA